MTPTAPLVCKPVGMLPLAEVPAFPPAVARALEHDHEIRTLSDLQPHVEAQDNTNNGAVRRAFIELGVRKEHLDQATWSLLRHLAPSTVPEPKVKKTRAKKAGTVVLTPEQVAAIAKFCPKKCQDHGEGEGITIAAETNGASAGHPIVASTGAPTPSPISDLRKASAPQCTTPVQTASPATPQTKPDDFDEHTPPPRTRPIGEPVPRYVKMPKGESLIGVFTDWDRKGRIPPMSVLCEFRGSNFGTRAAYVVAAWAVDAADPNRCKPPLGPPNTEAADEDLAGWYCRVSIDMKGSPKYVVMSREGA